MILTIYVTGNARKVPLARFNDITTFPITDAVPISFHSGPVDILNKEGYERWAIKALWTTLKANEVTGRKVITQQPDYLIELTGF
jgi:hypothetical protein